MSDINVSNSPQTVAYAGYQPTSAKKSDDVDTKVASEEGAVYEKTEQEKPATYSINKMSSEERAALVKQLKADQENRQNQLIDLVRKMMTGQAETAAKADESIWKFLARGEFTVDEATKKQAQEDISEDGYWGIKQTSQRLFDFASALAGDDVDKMKEMQAAMEKGFKEAGVEWGRDLPDLTQDTFKAANKLFEDYYASKQTITE